MRARRWGFGKRTLVWIGTLVALSGCQVLFGVELPAEDGAAGVGGGEGAFGVGGSLQAGQAGVGLGGASGSGQAGSVQQGEAGAGAGGQAGAGAGGQAGAGAGGAAGVGGDTAGAAGVMGQGGSGGVGGAALAMTCKIVTTEICSRSGEAPPPVFGQVFVDGLTNQSDEVAKRIQAEAGYGKFGTDPRTDLSWSFAKAVPNDAFDFSQDSDEYTVALPIQSPGGLGGQIQLSYAYRFTLDNTIIAHCDTVGEGAFEPTKTGLWTVRSGLGNYCPDESVLGEGRARPPP